MLDPSGSVNQVTHNLCNALADEGLDVHLYTGPNWARSVSMCSPRKYSPHVIFYRRTQIKAYEANSAVARHFWRALRFLGHMWGMARILRISSGFDVVHVQFLPVPAFDLIVLRLLSRKKPVLYTVHDVLPHDGQNKAANRGIFERIYGVPMVLFVHTQATAESLTTNFHVTPSRIIKIEHGSLQHLRELAPIKPNGLNFDDRPSLLFLGKIRHDKGLDVLLRAMSLLRQRAVDCSLLIVGYPNVPMEPYLSMVRDLGIENMVQFRLGYIQEAEVAYLFASATLVVLPYRQADQSGVAIGACTFGKALVASRCGGLKELVEESRSGILVEPEDPEQLATALATLLQDPKRRSEMEAQALAFARERLSWSGPAQRTKAAYLQSIKVRTRPERPREVVPS